jgi:nitric oxide reductase subunit B
MKVDLSSRWLQSIVLTFVVGFAVLGYLAIRIYRESPPVPARVVSESGQTVFTAEDIRAGQESFLSYGLMEYGSVYGHGAYLGPDFTADYLHREAVEVQRTYGGDAAAEERSRRELRQNRYDPATDVLTWTDAQTRAPQSRAKSSHLSRGQPGQLPRRDRASRIRTRTTGPRKTWSAIT